MHKCKPLFKIFRLAKENKHLENGYPSSSYGMSKAGINALTFIHARQFELDFRKDIIINTVSTACLRFAFFLSQNLT